MTRAPLATPGVTPFDGPPYEPNAICAAPGCDQPSQDPHHLWRRSLLGGAYDWVEIPEAKVAVGNVIGLCRHHHDQIEAGATWITLEQYGDKVVFCWTGLLSATEPILWQPPVMALDGPGVTATDPLDAPDPSSAVDLSPNEPTPMDAIRTALNDPYRPSEEELAVALAGDLRLDSENRDALWAENDLVPFSEPIADHGHDPTICPSCKRPLPQPKIEGEREPAKPRRTWSITVPKEDRENGAEVLDELLDASREEMARLGLPYGAEASVRYHVLAASLALFVQHAHQLMGDG